MFVAQELKIFIEVSHVILIYVKFVIQEKIKIKEKELLEEIKELNKKLNLQVQIIY